MGHQVGVGSESELWISMPKLIGDPAKTLSGHSIGLFGCVREIR